MHSICLRGARTHHLKGLDLDLHPGQLTCITGISGAGKSTLAFDTLYAEAQRRFVESFSPYARQFLERLERPPIERLDPVAAGIAVDRRAPIKSSRSTLATMADVEAYLSALFACEARPICPDCNQLAERLDPATVAQQAIEDTPDARALVSYAQRVESPEAYLEVREQLLQAGYRRLLLEGKVRDLDDIRPSEAGTELHVVVDRVKLTARNQRRIAASVEQAWQQGGGKVSIAVLTPGEAPKERFAALGLNCAGCGRTFSAPRSAMFSYQSAVGACAQCRGFGRVTGVDLNKVIPDVSKTLAKGAIRPWSGRKATWERRMLRQYCAAHDIAMDVPWSQLSDDARERVLQGEGVFKRCLYPGVFAWFKRLEKKAYKMHVRVLLARYRAYHRCDACDGKRLNPASLGYRVDGLDLGAWHQLQLSEVIRRLDALALSTARGRIAQSELLSRLGYLQMVGLDYLTLDRQARTLSGGEAQRVALTAALGSSITGALIVLDEPTVGLHPGDLAPLIRAMRQLTQRGNAVVVVEHDPKVIAAADRIVELGPGAGPAGGELIFDGSPGEALGQTRLATARALTPIVIPKARSLPQQPPLRLIGARANNLKGEEIALPLGALVAICGPSGSGKSTLVNQVLYRALARRLGDFDVPLPGAHEQIDGAEAIKRIVLVDQAPLGRTSRGNAATYSGAWSRIRSLFAAQPEAASRGFSAAHFSFNVAGGRCDACAGEGSETVEMQFLADVRLRCPVCRGRRFRDDVLQIQLEGRSIFDVLSMTVDETMLLFAEERTIVTALWPVRQLGLGYLSLGQPLSTLSGGEAQRLRLARELKQVAPGSMLIVDEPSAGLHADEVGLLIRALRALVEEGATVVAVEHDLSLVAAADRCIELGPGAGDEGGSVVANCSPRELRRLDTATGRALRQAAKVPSVGKKPPKRKTQSHRIEVRGAREHNLADVDVNIAHGQLVAVTGPSGSGKSSLAFDVIFAEGQRRFLETLTPYARQFLPVMPRPEVDRVVGVPPSIALEQRLSRAGVNSTVATVTEIAHYLRLLFAKIGTAHCPDCDEPVAPLSAEEIFQKLTQRRGHLTLRSPIVLGRKGTHGSVFEIAQRAEAIGVFCDGQRHASDEPPKLNSRKEHWLDLLLFDGPAKSLSFDDVQRVLTFGGGQLLMRAGKKLEGMEGDTLWSTLRSCPSCHQSIPQLDPRWFSFNTKQGRCTDCDGTGHRGGDRAVRKALQAGGDSIDELATCKGCEGTRLAPIPRSVRLFGERYDRYSARSVQDLCAFIEDIRLSGQHALIGQAPLTELLRRLRFVAEVGLGYLTLERRARTLSGGELQRLRLAAQLGSGLTGTLYVLDEPTIGLHPRDTSRLLGNLRKLVDAGSTVMVVEHDEDVIRAADHVIDLGPGGGSRGGRIVAEGTPKEVLASATSPTAQAFAEGPEMVRNVPTERTPSEPVVLTGLRENNLCIDEIRIPTRRMVVVAGVSGSGKSTLVSQVLYPALQKALARVGQAPGKHASLVFPSACIERVAAVDQAPIGRTARSVPATFLNIYDQLRRLFAGTAEARARGYKTARFSFNSTSGGGRCEECAGKGLIAHEIAFLPDAKTVCSSCGGARFEPATLEVQYLGKNIGQVLALTVEEAARLFAAHPKIVAPLQTLCDLGVGYLQIGQASPTLSGGEAQRLKLAKELTAGRAHKPTLYVLDEPTTGLHHSDVARLIVVLDRLVERGDSLVIIEHHPAIIAAADHVIELGPEGGSGGGRLVAQGSPQEVAEADTATGLVLRNRFETAS